MTEPLRTCCVCRFKSEKSNFIRIVKSPDRIAIIDVYKKLPGRGAYICFDENCLEIAKKSGSISKALKGAEFTQNFWNELHEFITSRDFNNDLVKSKIISLLGLSQRAKNLIIGTDNIKNYEHKQKLTVFFAFDASESVKNFANNFTEHFELNLNINELSQSIGIAANVQIIAVLKNSGFSKKIKNLLQLQK